MKARKFLAVTTMALVLVCVLCACSFLGLGKDDDTTTGDNVSTITVAVYGVSGYNSSDFIDEFGRFRIPKEQPTKEGYDFVGWFLDEEGKQKLEAGKKASGMVSIYAIFDDAMINVKIYDEYNGNSTVKVKYGNKLNLQDPESEGYFFVGWFADAERTKEFDLTQNITKEMEIYVGWTYASYNITYELNGGNFAGETPIASYSMGDTVILPKPTKTNYKFSGWYTSDDFSGAKVEKLEKEKGDKKLYAKYICCLAEMNEKQSFSEKTGEKAYRIYTDYTKHDLEMLNYFEFSENATITVISAEDQQTVPGGVISITANEGEAVRSFEFSVRVTSESGDVSAIYMVTVYQYDAATLEIKYYVDGAIVNIQSIQKGGNIATPYEYTGEKEGYSFVCWKQNDSEYDFDAPVTDNIELVAAFSPIKYNLAYSLGIAKNNEENPETFTVESSMLADPTVPAGYTFAGWFLDSDYSEQLTAFVGIIGDKTVYAAYTKDAFWTFVPSSNEPETGSYERRDPETDEVIETINYEAECYEVTKEEYPKFFNYCLFAGKDCVSVKIEGMAEMSSEERNALLNSDSGDYSTGYSTYRIIYSDRVIIIFSGITKHPQYKSEGGIYRQLDFVAYSGNGDREEDFGDFAVDHIRVAMDVETSEQLLFALEKGYRPNCASGSVAETLYTAMRTALKDIIGKNWEEKDKVIAIAEYLVETVAYDNATLEKFGTEEDLNEYNCFYLEGAIIDKVAVCDGISKTFVCMCRIEGITAIKVNGTHAGVAHAWNKVFIDADGNGEKEWYVVDCTSSNTGVAVESVEIVNHAFILTTDDFLESKNYYVYDTKWVGQYVANSEYDIYTDTGYHVEDKTTLQNVMSAYMVKYNTLNAEVAEGDAKTELVIDFCVKSDLVFEEKEDETKSYTDDMVAVLRSVGLSIDQINHNMKLFTPAARDDEYCILVLYIIDESK